MAKTTDAASTDLGEPIMGGDDPDIILPGLTEPIWGGISPSRQDSTITRPPDAEDWKEIVKQIASLQRTIANCCGGTNAAYGSVLTNTQSSELNGGRGRDIRSQFDPNYGVSNRLVLPTPIKDDLSMDYHVAKDRFKLIHSGFYTFYFDSLVDWVRYVRSDGFPGGSGILFGFSLTYILDGGEETPLFSYDFTDQTYENTGPRRFVPQQVAHIYFTIETECIIQMRVTLASNIYVCYSSLRLHVVNY